MGWLSEGSCYEFSSLVKACAVEKDRRERWGRSVLAPLRDGNVGDVCNIGEGFLLFMFRLRNMLVVTFFM